MKLKMEALAELTPFWFQQQRLEKSLRNYLRNNLDDGEKAMHDLEKGVLGDNTQLFR